MIRIILTLTLLIASALPCTAQDSHEDPYTAAPYFVPYDGSFRYGAEFGITVDTVDINSPDESALYFAHEPLPMHAGPSTDTRVVRRYGAGDSIRVGRMYPDGWAKVWALPGDGSATIIGWVNRTDTRLQHEPPRPRYTRRRTGRSGSWFWIQYPDAITDGPVAIAKVFAASSDSPYSDDWDAALLFYCGDDGSRTIVVRDPARLFTLGGERPSAEIRIDRNEPIRGLTGFNTKGDASILPKGWEDELTRQVRSGRALHARIYDIQGTPHNYRFDLRGSTAAIGRAYCFTGIGV